MKRTLCALIVLLLLPFATTHAAVTISVSENGADVVATTSGTLNLDGLGTAFANTAFDGFVLGLNDASIISTGLNPGRLTRYLTLGTPLPFMVAGSPFVESDLSSGTMVEIRTYIGDVTYVSVPEGYLSGTSINSTSTWLGTTIAGLGLVPGTYVFDWNTGGNADSLTVKIDAQVSEYTVGGVVSGLSGTVTLQNNGGDDLMLSTNGDFTFPAQAEGTDYAVTVSSQPTGQTCTVANGSGTNITANITNVTVTCVTDVVPTYSVGGSVSGLTGTGLALQNNGADTLAVAADGTFVFATKLISGATYLVTVSAQPTGQTCNVTNETGTIAAADVTNVTVTCVTDVVPTYSVGGSVSGLTGTGLALQNNGADTLAVAADGTFVFATKLISGATYLVTVSAQPTGQTCNVTNETGTIAAADVTNVSVVCIDDVVAPPPVPMVPIPAMSEWALILLTMLLGLMVFANRRRLF